MIKNAKVIVLGTGLKECLLSSLLSQHNVRTIQADRNDFTGGEIATIHPLEVLYEMFKSGHPPEHLGAGYDWHINLIQKFLMENDDMTKLLTHVGAARHFDLCRVEGDYVSRNGNIYKICSDEKNLINLKMFGFFEKRRFRKLIKWAIKFNENNTENKSKIRINPYFDSIAKAYRYFGIKRTAQDVIGHVICMYSNDDYKTKTPAIEMIRRIKRYYDNSKNVKNSPYLYPKYGIGELTEAFAQQKISYNLAENLGCHFEEIMYNDSGHVVGVKFDGTTLPCDSVICDPSYAKDKVKHAGSIIRAICILNHPISSTNDADSTQIIIPHSTLKRDNDIYITTLSQTHKVASVSHYLAVVATKVETECPQNELMPGIKLLGEVEQIFYENSEILEPINDGSKSGLFITSSYDATSNFDTTCCDVLNIYKKCTNGNFDVNRCCHIK